MLVWRTARYQVEGQVHLRRAHAAGGPVVVAAWHGMSMTLLGWLDAEEDLSQYVVVVPDDPRGEVLRVWVRRVGGRPFAISMKANSMVAARRLLSLIRQMKQGKSLYLNPDGPYGPTHEPKKGAVFIARKAGALIVAAGAYTATGFRIPRWDRYTVPLPFSRITVVLGEPMKVSPSTDLEVAQAALRERLNEVERAAEELYRAGRRSTQ
ncbi:MAG TPA: hypothetical protein VMX14_00210 [Anaerolineae bacterium]|nr:hypothetical protein [Anaerolineae bacterium]